MKVPTELSYGQTVVLKPNRHGQEVPVLSLVEAVTRIKADVAKSIAQELVTKLCAELSLRGRDGLYPPAVKTF